MLFKQNNHSVVRRVSILHAVALCLPVTLV